MLVGLWLIAWGLVGLTMGELIRRRLQRLAYRLPAAADDPSGVSDELDRPAPGPRRWVTIGVTAAFSALAWRWSGGAPMINGISWPSQMALLANLQQASQLADGLGWAALITIGAWLAGVDADVQRLPDRGQLALALCLIASGVVFAWGHPQSWFTALGAGLAAAGLFAVMHWRRPEAMGLGDVKLVGTLALWLGLHRLDLVFAGLLAACVLAGAYAAIRRRHHLAFGPALIAGAIMAGVVT
ncbi:MAG: A24 family peptidase [Propionibacteriaceae bacterium]|nr:A24 family peptidase [Propionibacteriaceae bacterium]